MTENKTIINKNDNDAFIDELELSFKRREENMTFMEKVKRKVGQICNMTYIIPIYFILMFIILFTPIKGKYKKITFITVLCLIGIIFGNLLYNPKQSLIFIANIIIGWFIFKVILNYY
jgi:hypothetical protein